MFKKWFKKWVDYAVHATSRALQEGEVGVENVDIR